MALTDKLTAIADAIRGKTGGTDALTLDQMATEISGIETGGGSPEICTIKIQSDTTVFVGYTRLNDDGTMQTMAASFDLTDTIEMSNVVKSAGFVAYFNSQALYCNVSDGIAILSRYSGRFYVLDITGCGDVGTISFVSD